MIWLGNVLPVGLPVTQSTMLTSTSHTPSILSTCAPLLSPCPTTGPYPLSRVNRTAEARPGN